MQRTNGRIVLPEPGWRRFRLPTLPVESPAGNDVAQRAARGWTRLMVLGVWFGVSAVGMVLTEPATATQASTVGLRALWGGAPDESAAAGDASPSAAAPSVNPAPSTAQRAEPPRPPPRVVMGLTPVSRQRPEVHQGAQLGTYSNLPSGFQGRLERPVSSDVAEQARAAATPSPAPKHDEEAASSMAELPSRVWTQVRGQGCEDAFEAYQQTIEVGASDSEPDVAREAFSARLEDFDAYARCDMDQPRDIGICVAVQGGKAKGVTVKTSPRDARLAACVAEAVSRMRFPASKRMDLVRTELTVR